MSSVAIVGAGVIGLSWARLFDRCGWSVTVSDPREDLAELVGAQFPAGSVAATNDLESAVSGVDFVQENAPERLAVKRSIFATLATAAPPTAILASSSSSLLPSVIAEGNPAADRIVIGHPFNPPEILPLVEIVPGSQTSSDTVERATEIYRSLGRTPVALRKEIRGFIGNRLQKALKEQAVYLVQQGYATVADIDAVMTNSLGPRWAVTGPFAAQNLGGGPDGPRHLYENVGAAMQFELGEPDLSPAAMEPVFEQIEHTYGTGADAYRRNVAARDVALRAVLQAQHAKEEA
ncbi:3-hydroxyacyl-CoA dehydrogenase NAD-binding domain-containing protein [Nocardia sp. CDC159]|uniref:3-hydroxyacyl-CoA dehydrogenase NAD-binding domain-containing protein n=1 Tax=Nocardia pulmonis TaxID=2951408 RepID=A0A9X2E1Z6_9NOCA|nr:MULTISPECIES: 3-hydroxyacyl-CoA dehydrogenase NAD-binding domain-containing protein [Nocardia]MCM6772592.1 3-hydroxyacyl-CoA dehydrogenase NAD-binding domain-containing protein [Nocardia pulmonis]MCM6784750.1 3-hydroxyacyl-CoA dehydrogenase NAD-binding domain-containing protein [Nocardia sp. CDC159]